MDGKHKKGAAKDHLTCNIALVAESTVGVGKTVLCDRYIKKAFLDPLNSDFSVEVNVGALELPSHSIRLNIYNVPGRDAYRTTSGAAPVSQAHGIMLVFDVTDRKSFESLAQLYNWIVLMKRGNDFSVVVVGTKVDLVKQRVVPQELAEAWCRGKGIENYFEVSGKTGQNVDKAFECLAELALWTHLIPCIKDGVPTKPNICVGEKKLDEESVHVSPSPNSSVLRVFKKLRSLSIWFDEDVPPEDFHKFEAALLESVTLNELIVGGRFKAGVIPAFFGMLAAVIRKSTSLQTLSIQGHILGASRGRSIAGINFEEKRAPAFDLPRDGLALDDSNLFDAIKANSSLRSLCFISMRLADPFGPQLADAFADHKSLQTLCFRACTVEDKAAISLFQGMKDKKTIRNLELRCVDLGRECWTSFVEFLKSSFLFQLCLSEEALDAATLKMIFDALQGSGTLHLLDLSRVKIDKEAGKRLGEMLKINTSLQKLILEKCSLETASGVEIAEALKTNICLQTLRLAKNSLGSDAGRAFVAAFKFNSSLTQLDLFNNEVSDSILNTIAGLTKIDAVTERQKRKEADMQLFLELGDAPLLRPKLFLCGREGSGKTTLLNALKRSGIEVMFTPELHRRRAMSPKDRTLGIDVQVMKLPSSSDEFSVWDYSGELDYYSMHEMFLTDASAIFMVVCSLEIDEQVRENTLFYWLSFIKSRFASTEVKPQVIMVGTCADTSAATVKKKDTWTTDWGTRYLMKMRSLFAKHLDIVGQFYAVDARRASSTNIKNLRDCLHMCHKALMQRSPKVPKVCPQVLASLPALRETGAHILSLTEFRAFLKQASSWVSEDQVQKYLTPLLRYLSGIGEIVWFGDDKILRDTVVVNPKWLCCEVMGPILAPPSFAFLKIPKVSGSIQKDVMDRFFKGQDVEKIVSLLCKLGICFIDDSNPKDITYNFPAALLETDVVPDDIWAESPHFDVRFGRRWVCSTPLDIFTVGFFPRFQVLAQNVFHLHATLWRGGLSLKTFGQHECVVLMSQDSLFVDVWVRCSHQAVSGAIEVMHKVLDALEKSRLASCEGTLYDVLALSPAEMTKIDQVPSAFHIEEVRQCGKTKTLPRVAHPADFVGRESSELPSVLLGPLEVIVEEQPTESAASSAVTATSAAAPADEKL